ncbi:hypothetical protein KIN20_024695 [Parelaphostrongylus tenuis]|uniref:Uncharacterized protein n=1 Tax=Parelaphostrongylus tenuis TaxID=148309 RepID=A0AAD5QTU1_PARTN|nr:hypothetical protein KIN20_024695 [Parelaphostrongylus tenuis]
MCCVCLPENPSQCADIKEISMMDEMMDRGRIRGPTSGHYHTTLSNGEAMTDGGDMASKVGTLASRALLHQSTELKLHTTRELNSSLPRAAVTWMN